MQLWDSFKEALGKQVSDFMRTWRTSSAHVPTYDHIPVSELGFFEDRYKDFLGRASEGEALHIIYERDEITPNAGQEQRSILLSAGMNADPGKTQKRIVPNDQFLGEFRSFLRSFDFEKPQIENALLYAQHLSTIGLEQRRQEHEAVRARYKAHEASRSSGAFPIVTSEHE